MSVTNILQLMGGLAQFLFGMNTMANGFKHMAGSKLQQVLEKLTNTKFIGLIVGICVTAIIQSSSATTSMLVGFVNAGVMTVSQTVGVIMGANIGTTVTGQLIALNFDALAPLFALIGVVFLMFLTNSHINAFGEIFVGLGLLFIGMGVMGDAMIPLQSSPFFLDLIVSLKNPLVGILVGAVFTALIQSSSASVGIIQTLAKTGLIGVGDVLFFNCGQHIGTCITAVLSSLSFNRDAKRVAIVHVSFNVIGTGIFTILYLLFPFDRFYMALAPGNPVAQIALMHSFFSIASTLMLFPFDKLLTKIAYSIIPDHHSKKDLKLEITQPSRAENNSAAALFGINVEINHMYNMVRDNIEESLIAILDHKSILPYVKEMEEKIDVIHKGILRAISQTMSSNITADESKIVARMFQINMDIERMGDHAMNLAESSEVLANRAEVLPAPIVEELYSMNEVILASLNAIDRISSIKEEKRYQIVSQNEYRIDDMCKSYREYQIERMKKQDADIESGIIYAEMLADLERIGDHIFNIAGELYVGTPDRT